MTGAGLELAQPLALLARQAGPGTGPGSIARAPAARCDEPPSCTRPDRHARGEGRSQCAAIHDPAAVRRLRRDDLTPFYEGRSFRKADVAASLARRCRLVDAGPLVMSGSGACAELLFALSLGRASGPVHEGTSCFQGALPSASRPRRDKRLSQSPVSGITREASLALGSSS